MSLTMRQRQRLREGRLCLTVPRRPCLSTAERHDCAVILGALVVFAVALWLRVPIVEDATLIALSAIAGLSGAASLWAAVRQVRGWTAAEPDNADTRSQP